MLEFCEKCPDMNEYSIREVAKSKEIKGKEIKYLRKETYCKACIESIFI